MIYYASLNSAGYFYYYYRRKRHFPAKYSRASKVHTAHQGRERFILASRSIFRSYLIYRHRLCRVYRSKLFAFLVRTLIITVSTIITENVLPGTCEEKKMENKEHKIGIDTKF